MRLSLHRFPRESKVAAVVLAAALLQVGVLAAIGLRSNEERRREIESDLAEGAGRVVQSVVAEAERRVPDQEPVLARELARDAAVSPWDAVQRAMQRNAAPVFEYAYLVDAEGRLFDQRRPPYPATSAGR